MPATLTMGPSMGPAVGTIGTGGGVIGGADGSYVNVTTGATVSAVSANVAAAIGTVPPVSSNDGEALLETILSSIPPLTTKSTHAVITPFARQVKLLSMYFKTNKASSQYTNAHSSCLDFLFLIAAQR